AVTTTIRWEAEVTGGVGARVHTFHLRDADGREIRAREGPEPAWAWVPAEAGLYQVRASARDALGNEASGPWSGPYRVLPPLRVAAPAPDRPAPQTAATPLRWSADATGGVGERTYRFWVQRDGGEAEPGQEGAEPVWAWAPPEAGVYRVRAEVTDALGNRAEGPWAEPYEVAPKLELRSLKPDRPAPQMATTATRWSAEATGGVGERTYRFWVQRDGGEAEPGQEGAEPVWAWAPPEAGVYRVRAEVTDALGNRVEGPWSEPYGIAPPLAASMAADRGGPQMATTPVRWQVEAAGGVGPRTYTFTVSKDEGAEVEAQSGPEARWIWRPAEGGVYRVRVRVADGLGNAVVAESHPEYRIEPVLAVTALAPDLPPPQGALSRILWEAAAEGGVGPLRYEFRSRRSGEPREQVEQVGSEPLWEWLPPRAGRYEVRVRVEDSLGNAAMSPWSPAYAVGTPLVAVLPFENLSAVSAPLEEMRVALVERLRGLGVTVLEEDRLREAMARHRIRYTGGLGARDAEALRRETGAGAVVVTSLETYVDQGSPRVALTARIVGTGEPPLVGWAGGAALAGDQAPGLLDLGLVKSPQEAVDRVLDRVARSLAGHLAAAGGPGTRGARGARFRPQGSYRSPVLDEGRVYRVAVLPVVNQGDRKFGGEILTLRFLEQLVRAGGFEVLDPGAVREKLLRYRIVSPEGASLDTADLLFGELDVDLLVTAKIRDYQEGRGLGAPPRVTFFVQVLERQSNEVVWASHSTNRGDEGVFFFGAGTVSTAHDLASRMVAHVVRQLRGGGE
ncbi:MAG: hypothetical protein SCH98_19360, partial [Deferrisomatales bacterium]|nr:hypothetical protein [Deferrisomatales bacterium]